MDSIAIVGLDCAFPGAPGGDAYWDLLMRGGDAVGDIPEQRWDPRDHASREPGAGRSAMTRGGFLGDADAFDNDFFSVSPREAAAMDPHHRLLLQCAWRALEDSGRAPGALAGTDAGVFVGVMGGEWGRLRMGDPAEITPQLGAGSSAGMTANRVSYHLNLTGPSLAVDTACSSSLVAVHLAAGALLAGECDTALAGGVNLVLSPALGIIYTQLGLASADGRCRPFSADADGIARSDGVGLVVLRRTADALADGQRIYAVIRGTAVNQDGRSNGVTAPNRWSQQKVVEAAYRRAGVTPDQVAFIEAHGTGTVLGDAIECAALGSVHGVERAEPCAIGSVKGNLGHTEGAAGIAGLIKAALALHHRIVPASRFADRENPQLRLAERGLRLLKSPLRLPPGETVAGVSSFGMGGTNAHAVLATAPRTRTRSTVRRDTASGAAGVFTLTGDTPEALRRNLADQADAVAERPRGEAAALCWSSNRVKTGLPFRFALTARDTAELAAGLRQAAGQELPGGVAHRPWSRPVVAFLFTGQGSQFPAMTAGLHRDSAVYRHFLDEADAALAPHTGGSVRDLILGGEQRIHETGNAQPALFAVGYALASTLTELGVRPAAVLGHSIGEYPAAVLAGVLSLDEAARLVAVRGALMQELPAGGGMLAVNASPADLRSLLDDEPRVGLGAVNGPTDVVLSGAVKALERIAEILRARGVRTRPVPVSHAFHSPLMAPALARFAQTAGTVAAAPPQVPLASTRYGRMLRDEPMDGTYWTGQAAEPVLFSSALGALDEALAPTHLVEIGPKPQLLPLAGRAGLRGDVAFLHPAPGAEASGRDLAELVAALFRAGLDPEWDALYAPGRRTAERLRPYVFSDRHRFWHQPAEPAGRQTVQPAERRTVRPPGRPAHPALALGPPAALPPEFGEPGAPSARLDALSQEREPVLSAVIEAVAEVGDYPLEQVVGSARFYEDLGFDSVMIMQLKDRIEARLPNAGEISVQQLLPALRSVGSLAEFLTECVSVRTP
ncbi:type I polyketide synthase [Streptomyces sp. H39-S7]|uniref:type I polyketide synthase n=1 Tax=Streptomyces sp. H39-S7 TaxID=3004357 RepID=UPI0022AE7464|nr:beta-ketoacyl synthase N-terminal-like domain-containing protein [Streptomyces sp. H39-S7]MCZ4123239.1 beta-ketoacyl synthase N-terminal-like domain-containing protein [Streptomyces sp. H39-S7]